MTFPGEDLIRELEELKEKLEGIIIIDYNPECNATYFRDLHKVLIKQNAALLKYFKAKSPQQTITHSHYKA